MNNNDVADSVRIQINIYSKSYQDAIDIFAAIRNEFKDLARIQFNHEDYDSDAFVYDYCFDLTFIQDVDWSKNSGFKSINTIAIEFIQR